MIFRLKLATQSKYANFMSLVYEYALRRKSKRSLHLKPYTLESTFVTNTSKTFSYNI